MTERESLSNVKDWGDRLNVGRVSKVTLGLLLTTYLRGNATEARTCALARMQLATTGMIEASRDYDAAVSIYVAPLRPAATFEMWLTQFVTARGFINAIGANNLQLRSIQTQLAEIRATSAARDLLDVDAYTTRVQRAQRLTRWALGAGKFNFAMGLETMHDRLWKAEQILRDGSHLSSTTGLTVEG